MKHFIRGLSCAIGFSLLFLAPALAQVTPPYTYTFDTGGYQDPIVGDGYWGVDKSNGSGPNEWVQSTVGGYTGGSGGGSALLRSWVAQNKFSRLRLNVNTFGKVFDGSEFFSFFIRRNGKGATISNQNTTVTIEYSVDGLNYTAFRGPTPLVEYSDTVYSQKIISPLPPGLAGNSSAFIGITITAEGTGQNYFDSVRVDDVSIGGGVLPIQLSSFNAAVVRDNDVEVSWRTVSEANNYGFEIYRKRGESTDWTRIAFIEGHGTTLAPQSYSYLDRGVPFGQYYYRIKQIDLDGKSETFPEMVVSVGAGPEKFVLAQNYPNPFNPSTLIDFVVPQSGFATMKVYNVLGQEVATLFEGNVEGGKIYTARFSAEGGDASKLPSGLYFYTLRSAGKTETKRMVLMK